MDRLRIPTIIKRLPEVNIPTCLDKRQLELLGTLLGRAPRTLKLGGIYRGVHTDVSAKSDRYLVELQPPSTTMV
jgi:hypothetical protein